MPPTWEVMSTFGRIPQRAGRRQRLGLEHVEAGAGDAARRAARARSASSSTTSPRARLISTPVGLHGVEHGGVDEVMVLRRRGRQHDQEIRGGGGLPRAARADGSRRSRAPMCARCSRRSTAHAEHLAALRQLLGDAADADQRRRSCRAAGVAARRSHWCCCWLARTVRMSRANASMNRNASSDIAGPWKPRAAAMMTSGGQVGQRLDVIGAGGQRLDQPQPRHRGDEVGGDLVGADQQDVAGGANLRRAGGFERGVEGQAGKARRRVRARRTRRLLQRSELATSSQTSLRRRHGAGVTLAISLRALGRNRRDSPAIAVSCRRPIAVGGHSGHDRASIRR